MRTFKLGAKLLPGVAALLLATTMAAPASAATATFSSFTKSTSNPVPSATGVTDTLTVAGATTGQTIGCVTVTYATGADGSGTIPGFSAAAATGSSSLFTFTTVTPAAGSITLKPSAPIAPSSASGSFTIGNLTNGSTADITYYAIVKTFTDAACSALQDSGVAGFVFTNGTVVQVTVDPTMTFTVTPRASECGLQTPANATFKYATPASASSIDLGRINSSTVGQGAQDLAVGTNANGGAVVFVKGANATQNLRSGSLTPFADGGTPAAGTANFSYTVSNVHSSLNTTWKSLTNVNAEVAFSSTLGFSAQCVGYSAAAASATPAGSYAAAVTYTAVPSF